MFKKGELFVDVGANIGRWSLPCSRYFKRVISFEPVPENYKTLERNIRINHINNIQVVKKAVSNIEGSIKLWLYQGQGSHSLLEHHPMLGQTNTGKSIIVQSARIDSLNLHPSLVKIDVEGMELEVLQGMSDTISKHHPRFVMELHDMANDEVVHFLVANNYTIREISDRLLLAT